MHKNPWPWQKSREQQEREEQEALRRMVARQQEHNREWREGPPEALDPDVLRFREAIREHEARRQQKEVEKKQKAEERHQEVKDRARRKQDARWLDREIRAREAREQKEEEDFLKSLEASETHDIAGFENAIKEMLEREEKYNRNPKRGKVVLVGLAAILLVKVMSGRFL